MNTLNVQKQLLVCSIIFAGPSLAQDAINATAGPGPVLRESIEGAGFAFEATLVADLSKNVSGGINPVGTFRHLFDFNIELDLAALARVEGATFFADFQTKEGQDGSVETGDLQAYSNIDALDFTALYEVWYQQVFLDGDLRVKFGKIDANSEFAFFDFGGGFIHSSPGFSPTLFILPTYPDPAFGAVGFVGENDGLYAGMGVFDGALQEGVSTGTRGPKTLFDSPSDLFWIGEAGYKWNDAALPGRIAAGLWHHTGTFVRFSGGTDSGATGFYLVFDQLLYKENQFPDDTQGLGLFAQIGLADGDLNAIDRHVGVGVQWEGLVSGRDDDALGLMGSWAGLSDEPGAGFTEDMELAVELFYEIRLGPRLSLKPDVQYITNPGGAGIDDAWVLTLRAEASF